MKITWNKINVEDLDAQNFVRLKSKKHRLTGKQSITQLVSRVENDVDPNAKFTNPDLNKLSKMGFLDELISGIKTGKEGSVFLGFSRQKFRGIRSSKSIYRSTGAVLQAG